MLPAPTSFAPSHHLNVRAHSSVHDQAFHGPSLLFPFIYTPPPAPPPGVGQASTTALHLEWSWVRNTSRVYVHRHSRGEVGQRHFGVCFDIETHFAMSAMATAMARPTGRLLPCKCTGRLDGGKKVADAKQTRWRRESCALAPTTKRRTIRVFAEQSEGSSGAIEKATPPTKSKTEITVYFALWYAFNIVFNILNKSTLNVFPFPWFMSTVQLACGVVWMLGLWTLKLHPVPKISKPFLFALAPVALFHTVGHVSACVSFSKVAVSFTHVIKSSEPVFSVVLSGLLVGDKFSLPVWLSLVPIVTGCSLAAIKELNFDMAGLNSALISNVGMVLRNIFSKKSLNDFKEIDGINLYALISIVSLIYLTPVAFFVEGAQWSAGWAAATASTGLSKSLGLIFASGLFYHLYNQVSYQALTGISPVTFSVGNTMKRVAVIGSSIAFFKNPVSPLNAIGSIIAIIGTFLYSQAKEMEARKKAKGV
eukprot:scaffold1822_cov333-Pavlova_lutheri.AAC.5